MYFCVHAPYYRICWKQKTIQMNIVTLILTILLRLFQNNAWCWYWQVHKFICTNATPHNILAPERGPDCFPAVSRCHLFPPGWWSHFLWHSFSVSMRILLFFLMHWYWIGTLYQLICKVQVSESVSGRKEIVSEHLYMLSSPSTYRQFSQWLISDYNDWQMISVDDLIDSLFRH